MWLSSKKNVLVVWEPATKYTLFLSVITYILMVQIHIKCKHVLSEVT